MVAESKKVREKTLDSYRKKAQEKKDLAEKVEKRVREKYIMCTCTYALVDLIRFS